MRQHPKRPAVKGLAIIALVWLVSPLGPTKAATIVVNDLGGGSTPGQCSLRDAIAAANTNTGVQGCSAGGIYFNSPVGAGTITNVTFSGNGAASGGTIRMREGADLTLKNTIVTASPSGGNCDRAVIDGGTNLEYGNGAASTTCGFTSASADPLLGALANKGGPTQTMRLLAGSPAIDRGNDAVCEAPPVDNKDQRGVTRPLGAHCDIGAFEAPVLVSLPLIQR
jgi:hypothetical protein